jgi:hypothetical protein
MIGFIALIHSTRNYSTALSLIYTSWQFLVIHILVSSVFTSRILTTDFNTGTIHILTTAHMKYSLHSLIPVFPSLLSHSTAISQFFWQLLISQARILAGWRLETQLTQTILFVLFTTPWNEPHRKHRSSIVARILFRGNLFIQLFHSNGCKRHNSYRDNTSTSIVWEHYLATAVSLAPHFLLWANAPQRHETNRRI